MSAFLSQNNPLIISGVPHFSAQTYIFSRLLRPDFGKARVLWLAKNSQEKDQLVRNTVFWQQHLTARNQGIITDIDWSGWQQWQRSEDVLAFATLEELVQPTLPHLSEKQRYVLALSAGEQRSVSEVAKTLSEWGFEMNTTANAPGVMARRGGIIDVYFSYQQAPVRLEWEHNSLTQIMDLESRAQYSSVTIPAFQIPPAARNTGWIDYLLEKNYSPNLANIVVVCSDPDVAAEYEGWSRIQPLLREARSLTFNTFPSDHRLEQRFDFHSPPSFHHQLNEARQVIHDMIQHGYKVFIASEDSAKIQGLLSALPEIEIVPWQSVFEAWLWPEKKICFLTDLEIFGERIKKHSVTNNQLDWLHKLQYGDYVVHLDHGIARFRGMTSSVVEGIKKEYFNLEYAAKDRLLVPVDMAGKLDKYIGGSNPKLHRLSGAGWYQLTQKIKQDALKTAQSLLALYARRQAAHAPACKEEKEIEMKLAESFAFEETTDQKRVIAEVLTDLESDRPTDRLVCGDVGFGKTEVALRAAARVVAGGQQVAILTPTTVLTQQHFDTFSDRFAGIPLSIKLLSRYQSRSEQQAVVAQIAAGTVDIVIGTHRVLQKDVRFKKLGLIIVDEEQRFGVKDKERLKELRSNAHVITLTATPIPRTLHMALAGLRSLSVISTPPEGRLPIITLISPYDDQIVQKAVQSELARGGQIYFLHNHVETIESRARSLQQLIPEACISVAHGQMKEQDLARAMSEFDHGRSNLLLCSTIIENGLDLPNANTLIVDHATNFGLAQLYQLRGRVGRSPRQAYAYFLYHRQKLTGEAKKRLLALKQAQALGSGWQIAKRDLEIRGAGEILGHNQHGKMTAIGLNLYLRLLHQAVEQLRAEGPRPAFREVAIDLPLSAQLPKIVTNSESERLYLYQQLAQMEDSRELAARERELLTGLRRTEDKQLLRNLVFLFRLKILAQKTPLLSIDTVYRAPEKRAHFVLTFLGELDFTKVNVLLEKNPHWTWKKNSLMIFLDELGEHWQAELEQLLRLWTK